MKLRHSYETVDVRHTGRVIDLTMVPVEEPRWVADHTGEYREAWGRRVFTPIPASRVSLNWTHVEDPKNLVGRGVDSSLRVDGRYWRMTSRVMDGSTGDHILDLIGSDMISGLSIGFVPWPAHDEHLADADGPYVLRHKVKELAHVALLPPGEEPAYPDARILAMRARQAEERETTLRRVDALRRQLRYLQ